MKVLVPLSYDLSSMLQGRNLRIVHLLRELNRRCDLTCVVADEEVGRAASLALPDVHIELNHQPAKEPCLPDEGRSGRLRRAIDFYGCDSRLVTAIQRGAATADAVVGFGIGSAVYVAAAAWTAVGPSPRRVCDLIDDPYLTWRSMPWRERFSAAGIKGLICLRWMQRYILNRLDELVVVGPRDAVRLSRATGRSVSVVPNGVYADETCSAAQTREPLVVFTGAMDFPPNERAADYLVRRIWPHVQQLLHDAGAEGRLALVGANPSPRVERLGRVPGVTVTGRVADVRAWLLRARVAVAPMVSGSGIKNKILEACASGCPVVTTPLGAEGLPVGEGICVADEPRSFARTVANLLMDESRAQSMGRAAWAMVRERYSWSGVADAFLEVLRDKRHRTVKTRMPQHGTPSRQAESIEEALIHAAS